MAPGKKKKKSNTAGQYFQLWGWRDQTTVDIMVYNKTQEVPKLWNM